MGAYKCDVVVVIKMGAYIHGVLIFYGCLLPRFYGSPKTLPHMYHQSHITYVSMKSTKITIPGVLNYGGLGRFHE